MINRSDAEMSFNKSLLELNIRGKDFSARNLKKNSPQCIVYARTGSELRAEDKFIEIGRTEVIRNNRDPEWTVKVPLVYRFSQCQTLKLEVWDYDICADNELLGETEVDLAALVVNKTQPIRKRLKLSIREDTVCHSSVTGELIITIDEVRQ